MNISTSILGLLTEFENAVRCPICSNKCESPVRIKVCGHYFCNNCLKNCKKDHNCPKCGDFYEIRDLDYKNIAVDIEEQLTGLRQLLQKICCEENESKQITSNSPQKKKSLSYNSSFIYEDKPYHINFVDSLTTKKNSKGETPLHLACKRGNIDNVRKLVDQKVDINIKDYAGWAPLHEAVQSQSLEIVEYLLKNGCLINIPGADYTTPLHQAVSLVNIDLVKLLLKYGADANTVDYNGLKPVDLTQNTKIQKVLMSNEVTAIEGRVSELFLSKCMVVYCHSIDEEYIKTLKECKNIQIIDNINIKTLTHFIIKTTHKPSFKILQAMLEGFQFFTQGYVDVSNQESPFVPIPEHIFLSDYPVLNEGIKKSMISALLKLPKLFDGLNFFIEDHSSPIEVFNLKVDKVYLKRIIEAGSGRVLHRPPALRTCESEFTHPYFAKEGSIAYRCCNFIIFEENCRPEMLYNMKELQHRSSKWLVECVMRYEICD